MHRATPREGRGKQASAPSHQLTLCQDHFPPTVNIQDMHSSREPLTSFHYSCFSYDRVVDDFGGHAKDARIAIPIFDTSPS